MLQSTIDRCFQLPLCLKICRYTQNDCFFLRIPNFSCSWCLDSHLIIFRRVPHCLNSLWGSVFMKGSFHSTKRIQYLSHWPASSKSSKLILQLEVTFSPPKKGIPKEQVVGHECYPDASIHYEVPVNSTDFGHVSTAIRHKKSQKVVRNAKEKALLRRGLIGRIWRSLISC